MAYLVNSEENMGENMCVIREVNILEGLRKTAQISKLSEFAHVCNRTSSRNKCRSLDMGYAAVVFGGTS